MDKALSLHNFVSNRMLNCVQMQGVPMREIYFRFLCATAFLRRSLRWHTGRATYSHGALTGTRRKAKFALKKRDAFGGLSPEGGFHCRR